MNARRIFMKKTIGCLLGNCGVVSGAKTKPKNRRQNNRLEDWHEWVEGFNDGMAFSHSNSTDSPASSGWRVNTQYFSLRPLVNCVIEKDPRPSFLACPEDIRVSLSGKVIALDHKNKIITVEIDWHKT